MPVTMKEQAKECAALIESSRRGVVLSGAGLSTNAGIPDFRGPGGLFETLGIPNPESLFDIGVFESNPSFYYSFHRSLLETLSAIRPTRTHVFLADMEKRGKCAGIITQNIDALHHRAGSEKVIEIHGGVGKSFCTRCRKEYGFEEASKKARESEVPRCDRCEGVLKPDIVFYGEAVKHLGACETLSKTADLFFVLGSSLRVTPAALLPAMSPGAIVVINRGEVASDWLPERRITLRVDADLDAFFDELRSILGW